MIAHPVTEKCSAALDQASHAVIGISPFNSYFSESRIRRLVEWSREKFASFHVFVPDEPAAWTLEALGYSQQRARKKARRQAKYLLNKINRALGRGSFAGRDEDDLVLDWNRLNSNPRYRAKHDEVTSLFESDSRFRSLCQASSSWVLEGKRRPDQTIDEEHLAFATRYFLAEVPLFVDSVGILERAASVFCYHQSPPFLEGLYKGSCRSLVSPGQGFAVLSPAVDPLPAATNRD